MQARGAAHDGVRKMIMQARSAALMLFATLLAGSTAREGAIKIGDINSYKAMAANMGPYRKGVDLAVEQINPPAAC